MKSNLVLRILFLVTSLFLGVAMVRAADIGAVKSRMAQRLGSVDSLKERQVAGENNKGYLEPRGSLKPEEEKVLSDENEDRRAVYSALAAQTGVTADEIGRRRAQQIASNSRRGVWIQAPDGGWSQKG